MSGIPGVPLNKDQIEALLDKHAGDTYGFLAAYTEAIRTAPAVPVDSLADAFLKWCAALGLPTDTLPNSIGNAPNGGIFSDPRTRAAWNWEKSAHRVVSIQRMLEAPPTPPAEPLIACSYGSNGYACCKGGPCQADLHNDKLQPAAAYAELPEPNLPCGEFPDLFTADQMRDFADQTHALRMQAEP